MIAGYPQDIIAFKFGCVRQTVGRHKENAARKLGAISSTMLIALVVVRGILSIDEVEKILVDSPYVHPFTSQEDYPYN